MSSPLVRKATPAGRPSLPPHSVHGQVPLGPRARPLCPARPPVSQRLRVETPYAGEAGLFRRLVLQGGCGGSSEPWVAGVAPLWQGGAAAAAAGAAIDLLSSGGGRGGGGGVAAEPGHAPPHATCGAARLESRAEQGRGAWSGRALPAGSRLLDASSPSRLYLHCSMKIFPPAEAADEPASTIAVWYLLVGDSQLAVGGWRLGAATLLRTSGGSSSQSARAEWRGGGSGGGGGSRNGGVQTADREFSEADDATSAALSIPAVRPLTGWDPAQSGIV
ncbi:uncharacterized protein LOC126291462 [Schistocerca gregaria]|uniref:uncharacterized protein LOC126291462 n=1 Tax=Schistocerca gregaria TaxID=7010 RepID=UPI00211E9EE3|nr:uncharacterized protein LOC126291462 [Schistocerca gregaria]